MTVYEAQARRLQPLRPYLRQLWQRRRFAVHMARTNLKAQHFDTLFGQLWTVLNPLLLAGVFYLVFGVILGAQRGNPDYLAVLLSGLFAFYYTRNAVNLGSKSVVSGGALIMNTAFPRALLPLSAVVSAFITYLPMLLVYAAFHVIGGYPVGPQLLAVPLIVAVHSVFNLGVAMLFAAATVYFRDISSFLPYFLRIWLYLSPILYSVDQVPANLAPFLAVNPLFPLFGVWHMVLIDGLAPDPRLLGYAALWALGTLVAGALFFTSRERDFAVRI